MKSQIERIRELQVTKGIGLLEAKSIIQKEDLLERIAKAKNLADIKSILLTMVR